MGWDTPKVSHFNYFIHIADKKKTIKIYVQYVSKKIWSIND